MPKLSVVILTKNEEKNIERCLQSVSFADEVIVIDDHSTDKTVEIAKKNKATVYEHALDNDFAAQRNFGLQKTEYDWVLFVDADEVVSTDLQKEISQAIVKSIYEAYKIRRRDFFWGQELKHGETQKVRNNGLIRLMIKGSGEWSGSVHEEFYTKANVGMLKKFLDHYPHQTIKEFLESVNHYSTVRARELEKAGTKTNSFEIVLLPFGKFLLNYFLYLGFLDGPAGFAYSFFMSFHSFLVRAKLFQYTEYEENG
jgi:glycosyltransferase involved in cell wall biosynthesis